MDLTMWNIDHNTLKIGIYGDPNVFWTMDENRYHTAEKVAAK